MINTRIISVKTSPWEERRIRYETRRANLENFIESTKSPIIIQEAIIPSDFEILNGKANYLDKTYDLSIPIDFYIANTLSHIKIWEIDEDTLILEDDVLLTEINFTKIYQYIQEFNTIEDPCKILYLQISVPYAPDAYNKNFDISDKITQNICKLHDGSDFAGTAGYFINSETKKRLLDNIKSIKPCDQYLHQYQKEGFLSYYTLTNQSDMIKLDTRFNFA